MKLLFIYRFIIFSLWNSRSDKSRPYPRIELGTVALRGQRSEA